MDLRAFRLLIATEQACIASFSMVGRGDEKKADQCAVDAMRHALEEQGIWGRIAIGEGERDKAPMLYVGEEIGTPIKGGRPLDIAVDPLEGTTLASQAMGGSLCVLAAAEQGSLLCAPDVYMEKLATGVMGVELDLDRPFHETLSLIAKAKGVPVSHLGVCILNRPRHKDMIETTLKAGARVHLITDGDVAAIVNAVQENNPIDVYVGTGGAPEGVLAAAALRCLGGQMQARLVFRDDEEKKRAEHIKDLAQIYTLHDLAGEGGCVFLASGVTSGSLLAGVRQDEAGFHVSSLMLEAPSGEQRTIESTLPQDLSQSTQVR